MSLASPHTYENFFFEGLKPDPILTVSEWADRHRILSRVSSAEPGVWKTSRTPYLKEIMDNLSVLSPYTEIVFCKGTQVGGDIALYHPIPTPNGWTTMGKIKVGDKVFDEKGRSCNVTFKSKVYKNNDCYQLHFSDGTNIVTGHLHRWAVGTYKGVEKILYTPEIAKKWKVGKKLIRNKYFIWNQKYLKCAKRSLPISPYLFGIWLGDGNTHTGQIYLNDKDSIEILKKINRKHKSRIDSEHCYNILIEDFCTELRKVDLLKNKNIPIPYLRSSYSQRMDLLKGLMDSDGSITIEGRCEYSTRRREIFEGVYELLMSLGIKASIYHTLVDRGFRGDKISLRDNWRISFTTFEHEVFHLKRKKDRLPKAGRISETQKRFITHVERVKTVHTACIEVDSKSHLYLCGKQMIPTHNTECGNNWIGYVIDYAPGPMLSVLPREDDAKKISKTRISPLINECPRLREKVKDSKSRDSGNTTLLKEFPGGLLALTGANSAPGLRSMPIRYLFFDEEDEYPDDVDGQGDPIDLAKKRTDTFSSKKKILHVSTPTIEGRSKIENNYNRTDQRKFYIPCPSCDHFQWFQWQQIKWEKGKPETAHYECEECKYQIQNWQKTRMLEKGEWRATSESKNKKLIGYHLSGLYSPVGWFSWEDCVRQWEDANTPKNLEKLKTFINTVLGESWKDKGEAPEWKKIYLRRENYGMNTLPNGVCFLTAGVDIQADRIECEILGWGRNKISWSIDYRIFYGDTGSIDTEAWTQLQSTLGELWETTSGAELPIKLMAVDSSWNTQVVYSWVRQFPISKVVSVKGSDFMSTMIQAGKQVDIRLKGKKIKRNALKLFLIGVSIIKQEVYGWLKQEQPTEDESTPYGFCHFPEYSEEHFKRLTAETLETKWVKGKKKYEWEVHGRNEQLDCRVYARAAASLIGMDRYKDSHWTRLESEAGVTSNETDNKKEQKVEKKRQKVKLRRRKSNFT